MTRYIEKYCLLLFVFYLKFNAGVFLFGCEEGYNEIWAMLNIVFEKLQVVFEIISGICMKYYSWKEYDCFLAI